MGRLIKKILLGTLLFIVLFFFIRFSVHFFQNISGVSCGGSKIVGCNVSGMQEWILLGAIVVCFLVYIINKINRL